MLEKPNLPDDQIITCLRQVYGLPITAITFLPLGVDVNAAVYRALTFEASYFVKLRWGSFQEIAVRLPHFLAGSGLEQIIPPLVTQAGSLWAELDTCRVIVYPFIDGQDAYEHDLSDQHWVTLGRAFKRIHSLTLPDSLLISLPHEHYAPHWRESVHNFLERVEVETWLDPVAVQVAYLLRDQRARIRDLLDRTEWLALSLQSRPPEHVVCHSDVHAGNVLIDARDALYIVDWDSPILAPKERDLMYAGGGQFGDRRAPAEEERLFYQGYGAVPLDERALAYYRYERIIEDIAAYCEQVLLTDAGGEDRAQAFFYLRSNFLPKGTLEIACKADCA